MSKPYDKPMNSLFANWARDEQLLKMIRKAGLRLPGAPVGTAVSVGLPPFTDEVEPKEP